MSIAAPAGAEHGGQAGERRLQHRRQVGDRGDMRGAVGVTHPFRYPKELRPVLLGEKMRDARQRRVEEDVERDDSLVPRLARRADLAAEIDLALADQAARLQRGGVAAAVAAVQRHQRHALALVQRVAHVPAEGEAADAQIVDQRFVIDAHQLDGAARHHRQAGAGAPRMPARRGEGEAERRIMGPRGGEVADENERMVDAGQGAQRGAPKLSRHSRRVPPDRRRSPPRCSWSGCRR
jgi:hypothetical protein